MTTMIERVARAMVAELGGGPSCESERCMCCSTAERWQCVLHTTPQDLARAALEAMREPSEEMVSALQGYACCAGYVQEGWSAAMTAALGEGGE